MASALFQDEPATPQRIGAGSFASIYVVRGGLLAFKIVHVPTQASTLRLEFEALQAIYRLCNSDSFFRIPKPMSYYDPRDDTLLQTPSSSQRQSRRSALSRQPQLVGIGVFRALGQPDPVYAMNRVFALPYQASKSICARYIPKALVADAGLRLCRLYFGKIYTDETPHFVNTNNFPLDVKRFNMLRHDNEDLGLPSAEEVALEMGDMLARIHWRAGLDARDVEFIMGGDGITSSITFYVIDFNQVWFLLGPFFMD